MYTKLAYQIPDSGNWKDGSLKTIKTVLNTIGKPPFFPAFQVRYFTSGSKDSTERPSFFLNSMIPFSEVDGINPLCIATKGDDEGKVYLVEWYFHLQNSGSLLFPKQLVANLFDEFLAMMSVADEDIEYKELISSC